MKDRNRGRMTIRFPEKLRNWIKQQAEDSNRSMNGQVIEFVKEAKDRKEEMQK